MVNTTSAPTYTHTGLSDGDKVTCMLTTNGQLCATSTTALSNELVIDMVSPQQPQVIVSASATKVYSGTSVTFTAVTQVPVTVYQWQINDINYGTNASVFTTSKLQDGDRVTCIVTVANACAVQGTGNVIMMNIISPFVLKNIPNSFTPNGDGINDRWEITELAAYPACRVKIFSRNGLLLYQSKGYANAWEGVYNGKKLPVGTYYYIISPGTEANGSLSGSVTILR